MSIPSPRSTRTEHGTASSTTLLSPTQQQQQRNDIEEENTNTTSTTTITNLSQYHHQQEQGEEHTNRTDRSTNSASTLPMLNPHESYPLLPGPFVVFQGTPGDGMANTMDASFPHDLSLEQRRGTDDDGGAAGENHSNNNNNNDEEEEAAATTLSTALSPPATAAAATAAATAAAAASVPLSAASVCGRKAAKREDLSMNEDEEEEDYQHVSDTTQRHLVHAKDDTEDDGVLLFLGNDDNALIPPASSHISAPTQSRRGTTAGQTFRHHQQQQTHQQQQQQQQQHAMKPPPKPSSRTTRQQQQQIPSSMTESFIVVPPNNRDNQSTSSFPASLSSQQRQPQPSVTDTTIPPIQQPNTIDNSHTPTIFSLSSSSLSSRQNSISQWNTRRRRDEIRTRSERLLEGAVSRSVSVRASSSSSPISTETTTTTATTTRLLSLDPLTDENEPQRAEWWHQEGRLAVFSAIPSFTKTKISPNNNLPATVQVDVVATLPPGCTVMGTDMIVVDSETLLPIPGASVFTSTTNNHFTPNQQNNNNNNNNNNNVLATAAAASSIAMTTTPFASSSTWTKTTTAAATIPPQRNHRHYHPPGRSRKALNLSTSSFYEFLRIESPVVGYVLYSSVDGYTYLGPGLPSYYVEPTSWTWRVSCHDGAVVRSGLELRSAPLDTLPPGCFLRVTRKTVNAMGLSRLRIEALRPAATAVATAATAAVGSSLSSLPSSSAKLPSLGNERRGSNNDRQEEEEEEEEEEIVTGWCSESLNPLSGQRGPIVQPLSLPVPALYRVKLEGGAIIRSDVELSSPRVGHAPYGTILVVVGRAYSEHPMDQCIERLKLAGGGGWVSIRLNRPYPNDIPVVELVGIDGRFDPERPGEWHWNSRREVLREWASSSNSNVAERASHGTTTTTTGGSSTSSVVYNEEASVLLGISELSLSSSAAPAPAPAPRQAIAEVSTSSSSSSNVAGGTTTTGLSPTITRHERCLICLTEERTATIVHGETGHVACCLACARILKARGDRCPVCRLPIDSVIQQFWA